MIQLRPLLRSDLPWVAAMEALLQPQPWNIQQFQEELQQESWCQIALCAEQKCGYALARRLFDEIHLLTLGTAPPWQRQGVARMLLQALLDYARHSAITSLLLEVRASNQPARTLYQDMGLQILYTRKSYYVLPSGKEDALVMKRELFPESTI
ncbi:ribosomal protein S18-alanine N-acetyltransferase [Candidatus Magnetaquicoccus inordinatus]|uniref:ribosomal protein S18-alanine N-acetyltransferase n=1 Tax=Candidatus Magnetaquicoccus inordinatus TaxID=2496818 RepID=UPI00187D5906|nr:ribosomal protein S18-alanine N-acetyltransferase [Candidatus Magnetaquicoccus inordinatus]